MPECPCSMRGCSPGQPCVGEAGQSSFSKGQPWACVSGPSLRRNRYLQRMVHLFSDEITVSFACKSWMTQMEIFVLQKPKIRADDSFPTHQPLPVYPTTPLSHTLTLLAAPLYGN